MQFITFIHSLIFLHSINRKSSNTRTDRHPVTRQFHEKWVSSKFHSITPIGLVGHPPPSHQPHSHSSSWSNLLSSDIQFEVELRLRLISSNSSDKLRLKCQPVVNIPFYFMYAHERTTNDTSWISRTLNDVTNMNASNAAEIWYLWCSPIACMDKICI